MKIKVKLSILINFTLFFRFYLTISGLFQYHDFFSFFEKEIKTLEKNLEQLPQKNYEVYLTLYHLNQQIFYHPRTNKFDSNIDGLSEMFKNLNKAFVLAKIKTGMELLNRNRILNQQFSPPLLNKIVSYAEQNIADPIILIYCKIFGLLEKPTICQKDLRNLLVYFNENQIFFDSTEKSSILNHVFNLSVRVLHNGDKESIDLSFELVQLFVSNNFYVKNNQINEIHFINVVISACLKKRFDFAKEFISANQEFLADDKKKDTLEISETYIAFHRKDYQEAMKRIQFVSTTLASHKLLIKSISIRCVYKFIEEDKYQEEVFQSIAKNFKNYLARDTTLNELKKISYYNMITTLKELVRIDNCPPSEKLALLTDLENQLNATSDDKNDWLQPNACSTWLAEEINLMKSKCASSK